MRVTGALDGRVVLCVNGGSAGPRPGDWSPTIEWLVERLAPDFPGLAFAEVRYRVKSWKQLGSCIADGRAALGALEDGGTRRVCMLGFSMGGAVSVAVAAHPLVEAVVALAPWIPDELDPEALRGRRLAVAHGTVDGFLPGIPGVSPRHSLRAVERIRARGITADHTLIRGAFHGAALRPFGRLVPLPRADAWREFVAAELAAFAQAG